MKERGGSGQADPDLAKRERILDAAFATFLTHGYAGASTLAIATRAKVSKRELYSYFESKADLFAAGIKGRTDLMRMPLVSPDLSGPAALADTLRAYGVSLLTGITHRHVLAVHRLVIAESQRSPELALILDREGRQTNVGALAEMIGEAQSRKLLRAGDPVALASLFSSLLWGDLFIKLLLRVEKSPSRKEIARRSREATDIFLKLYASAS